MPPVRFRVRVWVALEFLLDAPQQSENGVLDEKPWMPVSATGGELRRNCVLTTPATATSVGYK